MKREKVVLISSGNPNWVSCKTIVSNLTQTYKKVFPKAHRIYYSREMIEEDVNFRNNNCWKIAEEIHAYRPDKIIFTDHAPHPYLLLQAIRHKYKNKKLPSLVFHLYGDFTFHAITWLSSAPILKGMDVKMICASARQMDLIQGFLVNKGSCTVCPFPVDGSFFHPDLNLRKTWRKNLGLSNELVITYSGRVSLQKNVINLIEEFLKFRKTHNGKVKLLIAGELDEVDAPLFGLKSLHGEYLHQFHSYFKQLSVDERKDILCLGFRTQEELRGIYNASDIIMSLSTHHDEDFGMAVAEAMATGCKALLTGWGGYNDFGMINDSCKVIQVKAGSQSLEYDNESLQRNLASLATSHESSRSSVSESCLTAFGIESVAKTLKRIHSEPSAEFSGFNKRLSLLASLLVDPKAQLYPMKNSPYELVWKPYYEKI